MGEPAEQMEIFQFELLKKMDKLLKILEDINSNLEHLKKK